jgi:hypothetical protein
MGSVTLLGLIATVSAADYHVVVAGSVVTKGLLGILVSLGIENWVTAVQAMFLYNLISISFIMVIAAMAGPRSEAAFCMVVPLIAGMFMGFGWLQLATVSDTRGLFFLVVVMFLFGVFIYMNEQNRDKYGIVGPGSKMFNLAIYLALFSVALTLISGFSVVSSVGSALGLPLSSSQPLSGTCQVGFTCDSLKNIDFTTMSANMQASTTGGLLGIASLAGWMTEATYSATVLLINIVVGIFLFPVVLDHTLNGIFPGISSFSGYIALMAGMELVILIIYAIGIYDFVTKAPQGSTL